MAGSAKLSIEGFDGSPNEVSSLARMSFREVQRLLDMTLEELKVKYTDISTTSEKAIYNYISY